MSEKLFSNFKYQENHLMLEAVLLQDLVKKFSTPTYVYTQQGLEDSLQAYTQAIQSAPILLCYAVKANSNLSILQFFAQKGLGFDVVSMGELQRVIRVGGDPQRVVFSGVAKSAAEIKFALQNKIACLNVESISELKKINDIASAQGVKAPVSLRINPDIDAKTHPYISTGLKNNKFGIDHSVAVQAYQFAHTLSGIELVGIDCHIGSQINDMAPFLAALERILAMVAQLEAVGIVLKHIDLGGGIGIRYDSESCLCIQDYIQAIQKRCAGLKQQVLLEPGRSLVGNAGCLLTRVEYLKQNVNHHFAIVDAAMNDLLRPALYDAYHRIVPIKQHQHLECLPYDIVGPVCETGDFLGKNRILALEEGDVLAVLSAGAYGMSMSSNYNSRCKAAEVLVSGSEMHLIRQRENFEQLIASELLAV